MKNYSSEPKIVIDGTAFDRRFFAKISHLGLSVRTNNCLKNDFVQYVGDLVQIDADELLRSPNFGTTSLVELKSALEKLQLQFNMHVAGWYPFLNPNPHTRSFREKVETESKKIFDSEFSEVEKKILTIMKETGIEETSLTKPFRKKIKNFTTAIVLEASKIKP